MQEGQRLSVVAPLLSLPRVANNKNIIPYGED